MYTVPVFSLAHGRKARSSSRHRRTGAKREREKKKKRDVSHVGKKGCCLVLWKGGSVDPWISVNMMLHHLC